MHLVPDPGTTVRLEALLTGEVPMPESYVYRGGGGNRLTRAVTLLRPSGKLHRAPCLAYVIRHPEAGPVLIDTGMHHEARTDLRRDFGPVMGLLFRGIRIAERSYEEQLRSLGVDPEQVERVVMTHLHVDHTSGMRLLPGARFTCDRREWKAAHRRMASVNGYVGHHLPPESRMSLIDFDRDGEPFGAFTRTVDLLGDGSIRLISTPGHTIGHLSVLVALEGRRVLIVGDALYTLRNLRERMLPLLAGNEDAYLRSLLEIEAFAEADPEAILVPTHDPTAWHALREVSGSVERALA